MKKLIVVVVMMVLAGCGGGGSAPAQSSVTTITPSFPTPAAAAITISGKITGASQGTPVALICDKAMAAPPGEIGCSMPDGGGYILDTLTSIDANGNYSFTQIRASLHPDIWIPIPTGYTFTVTPSLWLYPIFNYDPQPYTFCPARYTFGVTASATGANFNEILSSQTCNIL